MDITERKQAEEELARKEAQLRVALDNTPGGIRLLTGTGITSFSTLDTSNCMIFRRVSSKSASIIGSRTSTRPNAETLGPVIRRR